LDLLITHKAILKQYGTKTNPIGNRLGIIRGWDSNWYGGNDYGDKLAEDHKIRKYIHARLSLVYLK
jgi:small subunit ribosomal protein S3